jgi:hypothetical protein
MGRSYPDSRNLRRKCLERSQFCAIRFSASDVPLVLCGIAVAALDLDAAKAVAFFLRRFVSSLTGAARQGICRAGRKSIRCSADLPRAPGTNIVGKVTERGRGQGPLYLRPKFRWIATRCSGMAH